jgi:hypothetical protein
MLAAAGTIVNLVVCVPTTLTLACAVLPFTGPAVTVAVPVPNVNAGNSASAAPAGIVTA